MQKLRYPVNFIGITTYYSQDHQALDLGWHDTPNEPIYACADGKVTNIWQDEQFGGGLSLHIDYDNGYGSDFKHLSSTIVNVGDRVSQAQQVAVMGNSGWASGGNHLHYNCYKNGTRVNPIDYTYVYPGQEVSNSCKDRVLYYNGDEHPQEGDIYKVDDYEGLYLCDDNGSKIRAYVNGTQVKFLGMGYYKYGYQYYYVQVLQDGAVGYMASEYLTFVETPQPEPTPEPMPDPIDDKDKQIEELNNKIALQEKQIQELENYITTFKNEYRIEDSNEYQIQMYKDETLCIKFAKDALFNMTLDKGDIVRVK